MSIIREEQKAVARNSMVNVHMRHVHGDLLNEEKLSSIYLESVDRETFKTVLKTMGHLFPSLYGAEKCVDSLIDLAKRAGERLLNRLENGQTFYTLSEKVEIDTEIDIDEDFLNLLYANSNDGEWSAYIHVYASGEVSLFPYIGDRYVRFWYDTDVKNISVYISYDERPSSSHMDVWLKALKGTGASVVTTRCQKI
jgi:hypothetical protein